MVYRHPCPGPGRGVRIRGELKKEYADLLRRADHIFIEGRRNFDWYHKTSQAFVVFQPVKSVGVVGDGRRYAWVVALRAVETIDFMTARWAHLPYELLEKVSNRIINEIEGIRSEEHTSELQSLMRISYAVFCLKKHIQQYTTNLRTPST